MIIPAVSCVFYSGQMPNETAAAIDFGIASPKPVRYISRFTHNFRFSDNITSMVPVIGDESANSRAP
jgi:hypothetical protein